MPYPNAEEFIDILLSYPLEVVVKKYVFEGTPYVFRERPLVHDALQQHLCSALSLSMRNVIVVGSAKIGFSLSPDNFSRKFSDKSDIDVLIVDAGLFDKIWMTLLGWHYPRRLSVLDKVDARWIKTRRKDLYWGWFVPDRIRFEGLSLPYVLKPLRDISADWFNAFRSLSQYSQYPEFAHREISGRLYRTWEHALLYHVEGLRQIKNKLQAQ